MNIPFKQSPIALNAALLSPSNIFDLLPAGIPHPLKIENDLNYT